MRVPIKPACASFLLQYRKQMRHTMNRTDLHGRGVIPTCTCRGPHALMPTPSQPSACTGRETAASVSAPCPTQPHPHDTPALAMAYVRMQPFGELYDPCTALIAGTLFADLDKPFCGDTVSASAYPNPPARTCSCALGCGTRGGMHHG